MEPNLHFYSWYNYFPIKVNGINFDRTNNTFEWFRQAKIDLLKFQNKKPKRKDVRINDSKDLKQIYIENNLFPSSKDISKIKLDKLADFGEITI